jgi:hypothetical protein
VTGGGDESVVEWQEQNNNICSVGFVRKSPGQGSRGADETNRVILSFRIESSGIVIIASQQVETAALNGAIGDRRC